MIRAVCTLLGCFVSATLAGAQTLVLDTFNAGAATGSVRAGSTWAGNVSSSGGTITVGGTARDDNGWGATGQSINATGMNFLAVTAQRDAGHVASTFTIQFEDRNLNTQVFSVAASAFPAGALTQVQIPLSGWSAGFDRAQIVGWSIGGGGIGSTAFRMTFDHLALTGTSDPSAPVAPGVTGDYGARTRAAGESISFSVTATGSTPFTYQWFKDNTALPSATSATLTLSTLVATQSGTYHCVVTNAAGSVTSGSFALTVTATPATVALANLAQVYTGTPRPATATTSPTGLPVSLTYNGSATAPTSAGTYAIVATVNHPSYSGRAEGTLVIARAPQSITLGALPTTLAIGTPVVLSATSSSGGSVAFAIASGNVELSGTTLTPRGATSITLRATQAGDGNYLPASVDFVFVTTKQNQSITFAALSNTASDAPITLSATATSNLPVAFSVVAGPAGVAGNTLTVTGAGLVIVRASQPGNDTFNAAPEVDRAFVAAAPPPPATLPVIVRGPASQTATLGRPFTLSVDVTGTAPFTYRWSKDGTVIAGATNADLTLPAAIVSSAGSYVVAVTNSAGTVQSSAAVITVSEEAPEARLANFSTRARAGGGEQVVIAGFVISGTAPKQVLVRAVGPALAQFGVEGALAAPTLEVFQGERSLARNAGWSSNANAAAVASAAQQAGAFALTAGTTDSAVLLTLAPGNYTAVIGAADGRSGIGLIEVYDLSLPTRGQLISNLSIRATAASGADTLIVGIVVQGDSPKRLLVRAAGPALGQFGVSGFILQPQLAVLSGTTELARNSGWSTATNSSAIAQVATQAGAFAFTAGSADAAVLVELSPGNYTAQVSGLAGASGVTLVEVYEVR